MTARYLYSAEEAAELLSIKSKDRVDELRLSGKLLAVKDGREYKYRPDDLQAYADSLPTYEPKSMAS
jgi:excisionase family DNA binding protein